MPNLNDLHPIEIYPRYKQNKPNLDNNQQPLLELAPLNLDNNQQLQSESVTLNQNSLGSQLSNTSTLDILTSEPMQTEPTY